MRGQAALSCKSGAHTNLVSRAADTVAEIQKFVFNPERLWIAAIVCACVLSGTLVLGAFVLFAGPSPASKLENVVVLMRHGDAPGRNEPKYFDLTDCSTQRNLSDKGRFEAKETGLVFRAQALNVRSVISSRWCRTRETAELLGLSPVKAEPAFDNLEFNKERSAGQLQAERNIIQQWRGPGILLVVTHSSNIEALTGLELSPGAMIVAEAKPNGEIRYRLSSIALKDLFL